MTAKGKRGRPRSLEVDDAILAGALNLFVEGGVDNVSYEQISKQSGVSRAAIYRRWSSRSKLLASAIEAHARASYGPPPENSKSSFRERLDGFILYVPRLVLSPFFLRLSGEILARPSG